MPLFNPPTPLTPQENAVKQTNDLAANTLAFLVNRLRAAERLAWDNPDKLTPQQYCDALGTDAAEAFTAAEALKAFINTLVPGTITGEAPLPYTKNLDGSVTIDESSSSS